MSPLTICAIFVQAFLIQSVFTQCISEQINQLQGNLGNSYGSLDASGLYNNLGLSASAPSCGGGYGGVGTGDVGVAGDIAASGNTVVVGAVPVLGAVDFKGVVPAKGTVKLTGQCGCGCN